MLLAFFLFYDVVEGEKGVCIVLLEVKNVKKSLWQRYEHDNGFKSNEP